MYADHTGTLMCAAGDQVEPVTTLAIQQADLTRSEIH